MKMIKIPKNINLISNKFYIYIFISIKLFYEKTISKQLIKIYHQYRKNIIVIYYNTTFYF